MPYRVAILVGALALAGTGLWLATAHALDYLQIMNADYLERIIRVNENGIPELHFCNNMMCKPYSEIRQQYMGYFAIDATVLSASLSMAGILFVSRKHAQTASII